MRFMQSTLAAVFGVTFTLGMAGTASAQAANAIVTTELNLRSGPDTEYPPVMVLPAGAPVAVYGCLGGWSWCDVAWGPHRGWVAGAYLTAAYAGHRIPFAEFAPRRNIPIVTFSFGNYWDRYYRGRPWYAERRRWAGWEYDRRRWRDGDDYRKSYDDKPGYDDKPRYDDKNKRRGRYDDKKDDKPPVKYDDKEKRRYDDKKSDKPPIKYDKPKDGDKPKYDKSKEDKPKFDKPKEDKSKNDKPKDGDKSAEKKDDKSGYMNGKK